nr:AAA family ATPase [Chitinivorax sp. B]
MEAVILIGLQATGKSTFVKQRLYDTHLRLNLDMLKTRHREALLLNCCIQAKQSFVVDNTNPTATDRARYIQPAKAAGFKIVGYYFSSKLEDALVRNTHRPTHQQVPDAGLRATLRKLERPSYKEGFDHLYYVSLDTAAGFLIQEWQREV